MLKDKLSTFFYAFVRAHKDKNTHRYLPAQGALVAVGSRALRENAELDRELHDSMPMREFTQPNICPTPSLSVALSL